MTDPGFESEQLADIAEEAWEVEVLSANHLIFEQSDFPAQIEVMFDSASEQWEASLHVYNENRGMMDLLSPEYTESFAPDQQEAVRSCIEKYMSALASGELDDYRAASATSTRSSSV